MVGITKDVLGRDVKKRGKINFEIKTNETFPDANEYCMPLNTKFKVLKFLFRSR